MKTIEVKDLTKYYGPSAAIEGVTFDVQPGEILGMLGPNGAGKTTTMRILTGYLPPTRGSAMVSGYDVTRQSLEVRRRLGYLPESAPLYVDLTPRDYLNFVCRLRDVPRSRRRQRIDEVMEMARITEVASKRIGQLSKGYRQRVGLAQALVHGPEVLILDEPTAGLDPRQIIETRETIKALGGTRSIILSTHILPEVSMTCNRVVIINEGKVVVEDTPENLTRRLKGSEHIQVEVRGPKEQVLEKLRGVPDVVHVEPTQSLDGIGRYVIEGQLGKDVRERLAAAVIGNGWGLLELRPLGMSLEEIFLKLTTREEMLVR